MFSLFRLEIELEVILLFKIFIFYFFPKALLLSFIFFKSSFVLLFDSLNHVIKLFKMVMMSLLHLVSFSHVLILENVDISSELFLEAFNSGILDWQKCFDMNQVISNCDLVLILGFV